MNIAVKFLEVVEDEKITQFQVTKTYVMHKGLPLGRFLEKLNGKITQADNIILVNLTDKVIHNEEDISKPDSKEYFIWRHIVENWATMPIISSLYKF